MFLSRIKDNNKTNLPQRHTRDLSCFNNIYISINIQFLFLFYQNA